MHYAYQFSETKFLSPVLTLNFSMKISGVFANLQEISHGLPMKPHEGDEGSIKA